MRRVAEAISFVVAFPFLVIGYVAIEIWLRNVDDGFRWL